MPKLMVPFPVPCGKLSGAAATIEGLVLRMCKGQAMAVTEVLEEGTTMHAGALGLVLPGGLVMLMQAGCWGSGSGAVNSNALRRILVIREASQTTTGVTPLALAVQYEAEIGTVKMRVESIGSDGDEVVRFAAETPGKTNLI